jgi:hypothetical protein
MYLKIIEPPVTTPIIRRPSLQTFYEGIAEYEAYEKLLPQMVEKEKSRLRKDLKLVHSTATPVALKPSSPSRGNVWDGYSRN